MGKMILDDLRKRLERLDEDADLMIDNNDHYQMVIDYEKKNERSL